MFSTMAILDGDMVRLVNEQRLGFVATVCDDGTPNLSPKGTMVVVDGDRIAFGEIRSPDTVANLRRNAAMEINFVDPLARRGYRFKGVAEVLAPDDAEFAELRPAFDRWGDLAERIRAIVRLRVERALPLTSPAYDIGASEAELRASWMQHFHDLQVASGAGDDPAP